VNQYPNPDDPYDDKYTWGEFIGCQDLFDIRDALDPTKEAMLNPTEFGIDGESYEIDLGFDNARDLATKLAPFIKAARIVRDERSEA